MEDKQAERRREQGGPGAGQPERSAGPPEAGMPGLGSQTWASEETTGLLGGSEPGVWARQCGRGPTSLRLPPAPRSWARPSLAQHWGSATRTGRAPSRPRAHAPSSPLRAVVSPALVGGLPGGRSCDPSPASASLRTVGASVAGA